MDVNSIDVGELRKQLQLATDAVLAHRISRGLSIDRKRLTWAREVIEEHVLLALREVDSTCMPKGWSWQCAPQTLALQVALAIAHDQKAERRHGEGDVNV